MNGLRVLLACFLALLLGTAQADDFAAIPPLSTHVVDTVGLLDAGQRAALDNVLKEYETRTGSQIAVLIVGSTAPEAIEQYGIRVADAWKLGRKGIDDGVIVVVAKDNPKALRRLRIEAGRGVQGVLTDAQSKRILQDVIAPHFRQNDFYGGLVAGVSAITNLLDQEHFAPPSGKRALAHEEDAGIGDMLPFLIFFLIIAFAFSRALRGRGAIRPPSDNGWGHLATGVILGEMLGRRHGGFGDVGSGSSGGFGGGFSGSDGGGFSGGGGGFDGGGASGDW